MSERLKQVLHFLINDAQTEDLCRNDVLATLTILYELLYYAETRNIPGILEKPFIGYNLVINYTKNLSTFLDLMWILNDGFMSFVLKKTTYYN